MGRPPCVNVTSCRRARGKQSTGRGERPAFARRGGGVREVGADLDHPGRGSRPRNPGGPQVGRLAAPALELKENRRLQPMAQVGPAGSVEDRDQPGSTGYALRGLTMRWRSDADSIHTIRTRKQSARSRGSGATCPWRFKSVEKGAFEPRPFPARQDGCIVRKRPSLVAKRLVETEGMNRHPPSAAPERCRDLSRRSSPTKKRSTGTASAGSDDERHLLRPLA